MNGVNDDASPVQLASGVRQKFGDVTCCSGVSPASAPSSAAPWKRSTECSAERRQRGSNVTRSAVAPGKRTVPVYEQSGK